MKKIVLGCFVGGAAVVFAACSSTDACNNYFNASAKLATLAAPCAVATDGGTTGADAGAAPTVASCETAYSSASCTSTDQTTVTTLATNYNTCVGALTACSTATAAAFGTSEEACFAPIVAAALANGDAGLSAACATALQGAGI